MIARCFVPVIYDQYSVQNDTSLKLQTSYNCIMIKLKVHKYKAGYRITLKKAVTHWKTDG